MPSATVIRLPAEERRATILEAAGRLFGERGYDRTTLEHVAAAAGVTKPIVYRHYSSKQVLYLALLERHRGDLPVFAAAVPADAGPDGLRNVLNMWLDYFEAHSYAWRMLFWDTGGGVPVQRVRHQVRTRARQILAEMIRAYSQQAIPGEELEALAELLRAGMASLVLWWLEHPSTPRAAIVGALARIWTSLLWSTGPDLAG